MQAAEENTRPLALGQPGPLPLGARPLGSLSSSTMSLSTMRRINIGHALLTLRYSDSI
jgi:hypothetical protein